MPTYNFTSVPGGFGLSVDGGATIQHLYKETETIPQPGGPVIFRVAPFNGMNEYMILTTDVVQTNGVARSGTMSEKISHINRVVALQRAPRPTPARVSGRYFLVGSGVAATHALTLNQAILQPAYLGNTSTFNGTGFHVSAAGLAGAVVRLAIYADNNGIPGELLHDFGAKPSTVAAFSADVATAFTLQGGVFYWIAYVSQVAVCTIHAYTGSPYEAGFYANDFSITPTSFIATEAVAGAFPAALTLSASTLNVAGKIGFKFQ